jgi:hypothetical protein
VVFASSAGLEQALKATAAPIALAINVLRMNISFWVSWLLFCYGITVKSLPVNWSSMPKAVLKRQVLQ